MTHVAALSGQKIWGWSDCSTRSAVRRAALGNSAVAKYVAAADTNPADRMMAQNSLEEPGTSDMRVAVMPGRKSAQTMCISAAAWREFRLSSRRQRSSSSLAVGSERKRPFSSVVAAVVSSSTSSASPAASAAAHASDHAGSSHSRIGIAALSARAGARRDSAYCVRAKSQQRRGAARAAQPESAQIFEAMR